MNKNIQYALRSFLLAAFVSAIPMVASAQYFDEMMQQNQMLMQQNEMQLQEHMRQGQIRAEASLQDYINQNRSKLEAETEQYNQNTGQGLSVEQYARAKVQEEAARRMNTQQGGTNPMFEQQKRMFQQGQEAHQQRQQIFDTYNQNWQQGQNQIDANNQAWNQQQRQIDSNNNRFIQQGIQGNQYYRNSETGEVAELPFAGSPGVYGDPNGNTYVSPEMGQYRQIDPNGMPQQMEQYEPEFYE